MDITTIIVLGLYTVVYVVVFIIQQNQVKAQKGTIDSMKSFMEIFSVDDVRKFVEMREETMQGTLENFVNSDKRIKESFDKFMKASDRVHSIFDILYIIWAYTGLQEFFRCL